MELFGVLSDVTMQQEISSERLSRYYSYNALGSYVVIPLGAAVAGPVADTIGTPETLVGSALVMSERLRVSCWSTRSRSLRRRVVEPASA